MDNSLPVAIVGMACIFPGAPDLQTFWENILSAKDAVGPIPEERNLPGDWPGEDETDRIFCTHGGFIDNNPPFSPLDYGVMPKICDKVDPEQLLIIQTVDRALKDAGIDGAKDNLKQTDVILGRGGYLGNSMQQLHCRAEVISNFLGILKDTLPDLDGATISTIRSELRACFAHMNADIIPFGIPNISTGRIANRFNMMGANYAIDAACASALIAVENAVVSLRRGVCDKAITGGVYFANNPSMWWTFSRLGAVSPSNSIKSFSEDADGMLIGEGVGILLLERLDDAVAAGRRIYAVIKGVGSSSDGRGNAILSPRKEGQLECLNRAYKDGGISPDSIDLIEGHGTGTVVGDQAELKTIKEFFGPDVKGVPIRTLGSVKSMIGHTMPAAGAASLIKVALSLYHKILPPTLHSEKPSKILKGGSCYLNSRTRPWIHPPERPRRAGINSFGFGGVNGHLIVEEFDTSGGDNKDMALKWPSELFLFNAGSNNELYAKITGFIKEITDKTNDSKLFARLSHGICLSWKSGDLVNLALVATDMEDLLEKLLYAGESIKAGDLSRIKDKDGLYFETEPLGVEGKVTFIFPGNAFPGLGDDYTRRLEELCLYMPCFRAWFDLLEGGRLDEDMPYRFSSMLFPPPGLDRETFVTLKKELRMLGNSADGVFIANAASLDILSRMGITPDMVTGTSLGEWSALLAGGVIDFEDVASLGVRNIKLEEGEITGAMGLAQCSFKELLPLMEAVNSLGMGLVSCSLDLSPRQVVFGGDREPVIELSKRLNELKIWSEHLNLIPIHTPCCEPIANVQRDLLKDLKILPVKVPVYSGATAAPYPEDPEAARRLLADNTVLPVKMRELFQRLYKDGVRIFVQLGGGGKVLTPIEETLEGKPFLTIALDVSNRHPVTQLQHLAANLVAHGLPLEPDLFYRYRSSYIVGGKGASEKKLTHVVKLNMAVPRFKLNTKIKNLSLKTEDIKNGDGSGVNIKDRLSHGTLDRLSPEGILARQMEFTARMGALNTEESMTDSSFYLKSLKQQFDIVLGSEGDGEKCQGQVSPPQKNMEDFPFVDEILEFKPGQEIIIKRTLRLEKDLFLKDHAFIPCPDDIKPVAERFPTVPMAVSLEIMAEAASLLAPGKKITGFFNVKSNRWINLNDETRSVILTITAKNRVNEKGKFLTDCSIKSNLFKNEHVTGTVVLEKEFPDFPDIKNDSNMGICLPCTLDPKTLYRPGGLYHGKSFQGLSSLEKAGDGGIRGILISPDINRFFTDRKPDEMILGPGIIDAASQLIACWGIEVRNDYIWVAPVGIREINFFSQAPLPGERVEASLVIRKFEPRLVEFDLFLKGDRGVWGIIRGWQDWIMAWPKSFTDMWKSPVDNLLSERIETAPFAGSDISSDSLRICSVDAKRITGVSHEWLAKLYLNKIEWDDWISTGAKKKLSWLLGRIAAKDAVRDLLASSGIRLYPSQVIIQNDGAGRPLVSLDQNASPGLNLPRISISHKENMGVALAVTADSHVTPGIDTENMDREIPGALIEQSFNSEELEILKIKSYPPASADIIQCWCAKEAAAKAGGKADLFHPGKIFIEKFDPETGVASLRFNDNITGSDSQNILVKTIIKSKQVFAVCII